MADFSAIRTGLATRVDTIDGLHVYTTFPEQIRCPAVVITPVSWQYRQSIGNVNRSEWELIVLAAPLQQDYDRGQDTLDSYLDDTGASSIKAALEGDKTLGGEATTLHVPGFSEYGSLEVGGVQYIGAKISVEVWA